MVYSYVHSGQKYGKSEGKLRGAAEEVFCIRTSMGSLPCNLGVKVGDTKPLTTPSWRGARIEVLVLEARGGMGGS